MRPTRLLVVLHAHLPWVRHPEHEEMLEERWLFEAITETYLPLLAVFEGLAHDGVAARCTLSLSPTLLGMLEDPLLRERYVRHLDRLVGFAEAEERRTRGDAAFHPAAVFYRERFHAARTWYLDVWRRDVVAGFRAVADAGVLELATTAATHPVLPLLAPTPAFARAQVRLAADENRRILGREPAGFWLPECAWAPSLDATLAAAGFRWTVVDTHGLGHAVPRPAGVEAPIVTPAGIVAFARDAASTTQVWSAEEGYPGDPWYRDFYRDAGFDRPAAEVERWFPGGAGTFTGLKVHRVTGRTDAKAPYDPVRARARVAVHAEHFVASRLAEAAGREGRVVTCPYDAELFGHWWLEGPAFLDAVLRRVAATPGLESATPGDVLADRPALACAMPAASTWGAKGHHEVWLEQRTDWIYPHLHAAGLRLEALRARHRTAAPAVRAALDEALRALLLAQASDWPFLISRDTAAAYADRRLRDALATCKALCDAVERDAVAPDAPHALAGGETLFPVLSPGLLD